MHGQPLPAGLEESGQLPEPVFTPSTKSDVHDENISFERAVDLVGADLATRARDISLELYSRGVPGDGPRARDHHRRHESVTASLPPTAYLLMLPPASP